MTKSNGEVPSPTPVRRTTSKRPKQPTEEVIPLVPRKLKAPGLVSAADIIPEFQPWVWDNIIPDGSLTILGGAPGVGKSTLLAFIVSQVSQGSLEGDLKTPSNAIWLSREDSVSKTLVPKLLAEKADLDRILLMDQHTGAGAITLPADMKDLEKFIKDNDIKVVVFDALMSFMDTKRSLHGNYPEAVKVFSGIAELCATRNVSVVGVMHLTKKANEANIDSLVSSIGIPGVARQVLIVGNLNGTGQKVVGVIKSNVGPTNVGYVYDVTYVPVARNKTTGVAKLASKIELLRPADDHEIAQCLQTPKTSINGNGSSQQIRVILSVVSDGEDWTTTDLYPLVKNELNVRERQFKRIVSTAVATGMLTQRFSGRGGEQRNVVQITPRGQMLVTPVEPLEDDDQDPTTMPDPPDVEVIIEG